MADLGFSGNGRFELLEYLGEGGMGVVFSAFDRELQRNIALKTLQARDPDLLLRFKNEFRALQDLQHPNLVSLGELFSESGQWFFTMELIDGVDLLRYVRDDPEREIAARPRAPTLAPASLMVDVDGDAPALSGTFDESRLRATLTQLAEGLCALHAASKVHRDIKPSNVLVEDEGRVVLLDFGLVADLLQRGSHSDTSLVGTTDYMAPEQGASLPVGPAADWYSLGVILYELLTGRVPFDGHPLQVLMDKQCKDAPAPSVAVPSVPADLDELCQRLLSREPDKRPTGAQVVAALRGDAGSARLTTASSSSLFASTFVGREPELSQLHEAMAATAAGAPIAVFVYGESGMGKSTLVRQFARTVAAEEDTVVLASRCYERESVPYKAFDGIIDELTRFLRRLPENEVAELAPQDAAALAQVFPVLRRVESISQAPRYAPASSPRELRHQAFAALRVLLGRIAQRHRVLLHIDDFQWTDADSLAVLDDVLHPPGAPPVCLIATVRSDFADIGTDFGLPVESRELRVERLPPDRAQALASRLCRGMGVADELATNIVVSEARGHPLFIHELVRHLQTVGMNSTDGLRLDDALCQRVEWLDPAAQRILHVVAVAGAPVAQEVVARAAEMDMGEYQRHAAALRVGQLIRSQGFRGDDRVELLHDRLRLALVARLGGDVLMRTHMRLATALEGWESVRHEPELLVLHLEAAGESERAAQHAVAAASRAEDMLAFDRAAELYETALRLGPFDDARQIELRLARATALTHAGRGPEAAEQYLACADGDDPALRLECQQRAATQFLISGHIERGLEALRTVLSDVGASMPATPRAAMISAALRRAHVRLRGLRWRPRHENEIPARDLRRLDVFRTVAMALGVVDTMRGSDFQSRFVLEALRAGEPLRVAEAFALEAAYMALFGKRGRRRADKLMAQVDELARSHQSEPTFAAWAAAARGTNAYFAGELRKSVAALRAAEQLFRDRTRGTQWELNTMRQFRLWALRHMGANAELGEWLHVYTRDAESRGDRYTRTTLVRTGISAWLLRHDVDGAREQLASVQWAAAEGGFHLQHWYDIGARAEVALYARDESLPLAEALPEFEKVRSSMLDRVSIVRHEALFALGRLYLVGAERVPATERAPLLRNARRAARRLGRQRLSYGKVWAPMLRAGAANLAGDADATIAELEQAHALATSTDMRLYAAAAHYTAGRLIGGDEGAERMRDASEVFSQEHVARPEHTLALLLPGFPEG